MSNLVEFEDLAALGSADLRAVFHGVHPETAGAALAGATPALRHTIFSRLGPVLSERIEHARADAPRPGLDAVRQAQGAVLDALLELARRGVIAFDAPDDMVA